MPDDQSAMVPDGCDLSSYSGWSKMTKGGRISGGKPEKHVLNYLKPYIFGATVLREDDRKSITIQLFSDRLIPSTCFVGTFIHIQRRRQEVFQGRAPREGSQPFFNFKGRGLNLDFWLEQWSKQNEHLVNLTKRTKT